MLNKKGMILQWSDFFKGLGVGLVLGIVLLFLIAKGIIPLNLPIC